MNVCEFRELHTAEHLHIQSQRVGGSNRSLRLGSNEKVRKSAL